MIKRTHLAIAAFLALFFLTRVNNKFIFVPVVLIASLLPDIDSGFSTVGRYKAFRVLQMFSDHRGAFHSFTLCILITLIFAFYYPIVALPFFLGYSSHLFADSLTIEGIKPFWPAKIKSEGKIKTGGHIESSIFLVFCIVDLLLLIFLFV